MNMLCRFLTHPVNRESGFDPAIDVLEDVQNQTVERFVEAFEKTASFFD
jgi:hypothetical protein